MDRLRIILAEDHPLVCMGFEEMLYQYSNHKLIKIFNDGISLWNSLYSIECDVLVLDIDLPGHNGFEILEKIKQINSKINVLIMSVYKEEIYAFKAFKLGAAGYIQKDANFGEIIKAIEQIASGEKYFSNELARKIALDYIGKSLPNKIINVLTAREYEVFVLLANGKKNSEIAKELFLSEKTISSHKKNIFTKLHITNLKELIELSNRNNII